MARATTYLECATGPETNISRRSLTKTSELAQAPEVKWMIQKAIGWSNDFVRTKFFQHLLVDPSKWVIRLYEEHVQS